MITTYNNHIRGDVSMIRTIYLTMIRTIYLLHMFPLGLSLSSSSIIGLHVQCHSGQEVFFHVVDIVLKAAQLLNREGYGNQTKVGSMGEISDCQRLAVLEA